MKILVLLLAILGCTGITGVQAAGSGIIPEKQAVVDLANKRNPTLS